MNLTREVSINIGKKILDFNVDFDIFPPKNGTVNADNKINSFELLTELNFSLSPLAVDAVICLLNKWLVDNADVLYESSIKEFN